MANAKRKVGQMLDVPEGGTVLRPDGSESGPVMGGQYVADVPGSYTIDGKTIEVEA